MIVCGDELVDLCVSVVWVCDVGFVLVGWYGFSGRLVISYLCKVFILVIWLCWDNCYYCMFVIVLGKLCV